MDLNHSLLDGRIKTVVAKFQWQTYYVLPFSDEEKLWGLEILGNMNNYESGPFFVLQFKFVNLTIC